MNIIQPNTVMGHIVLSLLDDKSILKNKIQGGITCPHCKLMNFNMRFGKRDLTIVTTGTIICRKCKKISTLQSGKVI